MNRYRCIAEVTARPIAQVGWYDQLEAYKLVFDDGRTMTTATFTSEETPNIGDYYIEHDDGSCEVVAKDVFEREYVLTTGRTVDTPSLTD